MNAPCPFRSVNTAGGSTEPLGAVSVAYAPTTAPEAFEAASETVTEPPDQGPTCTARTNAWSTTGTRTSDSPTPYPGTLASTTRRALELALRSGTVRSKA